MEFSYLNGVNHTPECVLDQFPHAGSQSSPYAGFDIIDPSRIVTLDEPESNPPHPALPSSGYPMLFPDQSRLPPQPVPSSGKQELLECAIPQFTRSRELLSQASLHIRAKRYYLFHGRLTYRTRRPNKNPVLGNNPTGRKGLRRCRQCRRWKQKVRQNGETVVLTRLVCIRAT